jgi:hypothetical protein
MADATTIKPTAPVAAAAPAVNVAPIASRIQAPAEAEATSGGVAQGTPTPEQAKKLNYMA